ncbi:MAG: Gfo/Idh/MocA family oxidoreductase [Bacteroidetes bacterium]|nr:Gfo/Idh/MocA family oxidoreductase [Bacteroidota bacterium]
MINKIVLVGLGYIGKVYLKLLNENPNWDLVGVYDIDQKLCKDLAAQYNLKAFSNLQEALDNVEVVAIATPGNTHFEIAKQAIINGRHVFIERPVTANIKEAKQLQSYINEAGVYFQVGHVERFNPAFIAAKPYLKDPQFIEVHRLAQYNPRGTDVSVVLDLMTHDLDLILSIVKANVKRISVSGCDLVSKTADIVNARIEFENGCVANITTNRMAFKNTRKFRVFTKDQFVSINLLDKITEVVKLKNAPLNSKNLVIDPGNGQSKKEVIFEHPIILPTNAINEELNALHDCINSNKKTIVGIDEAIRVLELATEIEEKLKL